MNSKTLKHVMYSSVMQAVSGRNYTSVKTRLGLAPRGLSVFWLSRRLIRLPGGTFSVFRERADKRETTKYNQIRPRWP